MNRRFDNMQDMYNFVIYLSEQLRNAGYVHWANEIDFYSTNAFTSASEYFGELRILLKDLLSQNIVQKELKQEIEAAIMAINKVFNQ